MRTQVWCSPPSLRRQQQERLNRCVAKPAVASTCHINLRCLHWKIIISFPHTHTHHCFLLVLPSLLQFVLSSFTFLLRAIIFAFQPTGRRKLNQLFLFWVRSFLTIHYNYFVFTKLRQTAANYTYFTKGIYVHHYRKILIKYNACITIYSLVKPVHQYTNMKTMKCVSLNTYGMTHGKSYQAIITSYEQLRIANNAKFTSAGILRRHTIYVILFHIYWGILYI